MIARLVNRAAIGARAMSVRLHALSQGSWISLRARIYLHPGANLKIGRGVRVLHDTILAVLPGGTLELQDGCILNHGVVVYCASRVSVGRQSRVAHYCSILDHDYDIRSEDASFDKPKVSSPVLIGDHVWVGASSIILKGACIGNRCVVGAHTLVTKSIPEGMVAYCRASSQLTLVPREPASDAAVSPGQEA